LKIFIIALLALVPALNILAGEVSPPPRFTAETEAWLAGDLAKTAEILKVKVNTPTADPVVLYNYAYVLYHLNMGFPALEQIRRIDDAGAADVRSELLRAQIMRQQNNLAGALAALQASDKKYPGTKSVIFDLAELNRQLKNYTVAAGLYRSVIEMENDHIEAISGLAACYRLSGQNERARMVIDAAGLYPESPVLRERQRVYHELGDSNREVEYMTQLCLEYPNTQQAANYRDTLVTVFGRKQPPALQPPQNYVYKIDRTEQVDYLVEYGFITLGWLKIRISEVLNMDGREVYHLIFYIDSNPAFDFLISMHHVYESYLEKNTLSAIRSRMYTPGDSDNLLRVYHYDYDQSRFAGQIVRADGRFYRVEKDMPRTAQDGTSLLYLARGMVSNKKGGVTTAIINEKYKFTEINYLNKQEEIDIPLGEKTGDMVYAKANFEGIAGMNGDAWGWFSGDPDYVPLMGKIKILLGSITVSREK
jgi:tetratricopeptide (TPR) repeat protein